MKKAILASVLLALTLVSYSQRIITAGSAITETVCALGECGKIIASDKTSLYPAEIQKLPSIGYRSGISAEGIISLRPTLLIAEKEYVEATVLTQIQSAGIKVMIIDRVYTLDGTRDLIRKIAAELNRSAEGDKIIRKIEGELAEVQSSIKKSKVQPKVLCVYNRGASSVSAAGTHTFSEILPLAGATSAVTGIEGYKPLNTEALMASNPDYILMFESGIQSIGGVDGVLKIAGVGQTTAGKKKQIIAMDGIKLSNFGPRLGEAVKELVAQFHPGVK
ncbi:MAG: hemin ABC transporter substrate-binding protein [Azospira oryzae]|nr:MAG: hemin ABC transporter substrate-binding protein [Azospira oryzae]